MPLGRFNADAAQVIKARLVLPTEIPDKHWNLLMITVEPKDSILAGPGERRSIAGYYPDAGEATRSPAQLPNTGGDTDPASASQRPVQPAPAPVATAALASSPAPAGGPFGDSQRNTLAIGVVVVIVAIMGLGAYARTKRAR